MKETKIAGPMGFTANVTRPAGEAFSEIMLWRVWVFRAWRKVEDSVCQRERMPMG
jgi:hypothetical protein